MLGWRNRRRTLIVEGFQLQFVVVSLLWLAVTLLLFLGLLFGPAALQLAWPTTGGDARLDAAGRLLALHEHAWPAILVALVSGGLFLLRHSHRLAGPVYRFRVTFARVALGDLTPHVRLRKGDYLVQEAAALDGMIRALEHRVRELQTAVAGTDDALARMRLGSPSPDDAALVAAALVRVRASLDTWTTSPADPPASPDAGAPTALQSPGSEGGFSAAEMLVTLAIIGTLFSMGTAAYTAALERARVTRAIADIHALCREVAMFQLFNGRLPATLAEIDKDDLLDPWGNPYEYLVLAAQGGGGGGGGGGNNKGGNGGGGNGGGGDARKDRALVPINSDFDLYSKGPDGESMAPLTAKASLDDIVRANDGGFVGRASDY